MYVECLSSLNHMPQQNHNHLNFYKILMLSKDLKQGNFGNLGLASSRTLVRNISRTPWVVILTQHIT